MRNTKVFPLMNGIKHKLRNRKHKREEKNCQKLREKRDRNKD